MKRNIFNALVLIFCTGIVIAFCFLVKYIAYQEPTPIPTTAFTFHESPSPSPSPTPNNATVDKTGTPKPKATPRASIKPVIVYHPKTSAQPKATGTGSTVSTPMATEKPKCDLDAVHGRGVARMEESAKVSSCDYGFLLCMTDKTNCTDSVSTCYQKYLNLEICEYQPSTAGFYDTTYDPLIIIP